MLNGGAATFQHMTGSSGSPTTFMLPSELEGPPPAPGTPNFYVRMIDCDLYPGAGPCPAIPLFSSDRIEIREFSVDWGVPANTSMSLTTTLFPADFSSDICDGANLFNNCVDQPDAGPDLETLSVWPMAPAHYRNFGTHESIVFNHSVDVDGEGLVGIRWYELRRTLPGPWGIYQQGTYSPPDGTDTHRWMGSIAMDKAGNMALGYSVSNDVDVYPGIRYTGRYASDPLGLLPQGEFTLIDGSATNAGTRWGDYSAMRVDPVDGCTFWYTTQYNDVAHGQTTRIGAFRFPSCNPVDLAISKTARPVPGIAGNQLYYDVTVENLGPGIATNVEVIDTLPGVTYITDTDSCVEAPTGTLTCDLGDIDAGDSKTFTIKVLVPVDLVVASGPTTITNSASVTSDEDDTDPSNNETSITTIVEDSADLKITKFCKPDRPLDAGETGTCTIWVDNLGPSHARNVTVIDTHVSDGEFTIDSASSSQGSCDFLDGVVTCELGAVSATFPSNRVTITVEMTANEAVDINDVAIVSSDTPDPDTSNNQAEGSISVDAVADLVLTKRDDPDPVVAGTALTYYLDVRNDGPSTAVNVVIEDKVPAGVTIDSVTGTNGATCNSGVAGDPTQPATCAFDSMAPAQLETMTIAVTVLPDTTGVLHNNAEVYSEVFDRNNLNNFATVDTTVSVEYDLGIEKLAVTAPEDVIVGQPLSWTIKVKNAGPSTATDFDINDLLSSELNYLSHTIVTGDGTCDFAPAYDFSCRVESLAPGDEFIVSLITQIKPDSTATEICNEATLTSENDTAPGNDSSGEVCVDVNERTADLDILKEVLTPGPYSAGDLLTWQITIQNIGDYTASGIKIEDLLPPEVDYDSHEILQPVGEGACDATNLPNFVCTFDELAPYPGTGDEIVVNLTVRIKSDVADDTQICNTASTSLEYPIENELGNNSSQVCIYNGTSAELWIEKVSNFPTGNPSGTILFWVSVHNEPGCNELNTAHCGVGGPSDALNVEVTDTIFIELDPKKFNVEYLSQGCSYDGVHTITCVAPIVEFGTTETFEIQASVKGSVGEVTNTAEITDTDTPDPDLTNNIHTVLVKAKGSTGDKGGPGGGRGRGKNK
jgi:uncharacterized repeat protein (TIGR01451 family)